MPKKRTQIIPAILAKDKKGFELQWKKVAPYFNYLQIDIMDGQFVKQKNNISPYKIKGLMRGKKVEIHLMVESVSKYIATWSKFSNVQKIIWHYEADRDEKHIIKLVDFLKRKKIKAGLAINPKTGLAKIKKLIPLFDTIQIMGVNPGKQGQKFQSSIIEQIKALKYKYPKINIAVDGGVNEKNFSTITKAGANCIGIGSYLQKAGNVKEAIKKLK